VDDKWTISEDAGDGLAPMETTEKMQMVDPNQSAL
jgi:hypothetical protein